MHRITTAAATLGLVLTATPAVATAKVAARHHDPIAHIALGTPSHAAGHGHRHHGAGLALRGVPGPR